LLITLFLIVRRRKEAKEEGADTITD